MNAITEVREQAIRSCLQAGFTLKQIAAVIQLGECELLELQLEMSVERVSREKRLVLVGRQPR